MLSVQPQISAQPRVLPTQSESEPRSVSEPLTQHRRVKGERTSAAWAGHASPYDAKAARQLGAMRSLRRGLDDQDPRLIREAAGLLSSQLFFAPLLAEMRKLPFGKELAGGGRMEEVFGEQLDLHIADTVARSDRGFTAQLAARLTKPGPNGDRKRALDTASLSQGRAEPLDQVRTATVSERPNRDGVRTATVSERNPSGRSFEPQRPAAPPHTSWLTLLQARQSVPASRSSVPVAARALARPFSETDQTTVQQCERKP